MNGFQTHGFKRSPQTYLTRHGALLLLALDDQWKQEKGKYQFTGGFDPKRHFKPSDLMVTLRDAIRLTIKKVLDEGDVYAHLLFLSEHKMNATDVLVRNHPGGETPGHPIFQMGKAGEELADLINSKELRQYIENDSKHWQAIWLYARLLSQGECGPKVWTPADITSLTGLNRGQISKAVKMLVEGFVAKGADDTIKTFAPATLLVNGTRRNPQYSLRADEKVSSSPEIGDLDFGDDNPVTPSNGAAAKAAATFADVLNAERPVQSAPKSCDDAIFEDLGIDTEDAPEPDDVGDIIKSVESVFGAGDAEGQKPKVGAHANLNDTEVGVLLTEASRLGISIDSLVTTLLKKGVEDIIEANKERRASAEAIAAEEKAIAEAAEEAQRLANEAQAKLDEVRRRRQNLASIRGVSAPRTGA